MPKTAIPEDFSVSDAVKKWARAKGWEMYLSDYLDVFRDYCLANGKKYENWDAALRTCIRDDWGGIRKNAAPGQYRQPLPVKDEPISNEERESNKQRIAELRLLVGGLSNKMRMP